MADTDTLQPAIDVLNRGGAEAQLAQEFGKQDKLETQRTEALAPPRAAAMEALQKQGSKPAPELKEAPQLSPEAVHKDANEFVSWAVVLGGIGGLLSRQPLVGAMNAFSGAMQGFREGDQARTKAALETFNAEVKATKEANTELLARYKLILDNDKLELNAKLNMLEITANQYNDPIIASQARAKNLTTLIQIADRREVATMRMDMAAAGLQAKYDQIEAARTAKENEPSGKVVQDATDPEKYVPLNKAGQPMKNPDGSPMYSAPPTGAKPTAAAQKEAAQVTRAQQFVIKANDAIAAIEAAPSAPGRWGKFIAEPLEWLTTLASPDAETPVSNTRGAIADVQVQLRKALDLGGSKLKGEQQQLEQVLDGLNSKNAAQTKNSLIRLRDIVANTYGIEAEGTPKAAKTEGYPAGTVIKRGDTYYESDGRNLIPRPDYKPQ